LEAGVLPLKTGELRVFGVAAAGKDHFVLGRCGETFLPPVQNGGMDAQVAGSLLDVTAFLRQAHCLAFELVREYPLRRSHYG
jgi:hypothetical protein